MSKTKRRKGRRDGATALLIFIQRWFGARGFGATDRAYSYRNAVIGSTFAARRAGIQQAINPAMASSAAAPT
jgi:hypothetical protein